jgi:hypothetical protein
MAVLIAVGKGVSAFSRRHAPKCSIHLLLLNLIIYKRERKKKYRCCSPVLLIPKIGASGMEQLFD